MPNLIDLDMLMFTAKERMYADKETYPGEDERTRWQELKRFIQIIIRN